MKSAGPIGRHGNQVGRVRARSPRGAQLLEHFAERIGDEIDLAAAAAFQTGLKCCTGPLSTGPVARRRRPPARGISCSRPPCSVISAARAAPVRPSASSADAVMATATMVAARLSVFPARRSSLILLRRSPGVASAAAGSATARPCGGALVAVVAAVRRRRAARLSTRRGGRGQQAGIDDLHDVVASRRSATSAVRSPPASITSHTSIALNSLYPSPKFATGRNAAVGWDSPGHVDRTEALPSCRIGAAEEAQSIDSVAIVIEAALRSDRRVGLQERRPVATRLTSITPRPPP